jgi:hypothetical protein
MVHRSCYQGKPNMSLYIYISMVSHSKGRTYSEGGGLLDCETTKKIFGPNESN